MMRELVETRLFWIRCGIYNILFGMLCTYGLSGARRVRGRVDQVYNLKNRVVMVHCWALDGRNGA